MTPEVGHGWNVGAARGGFERENPAFTKIASWRFALKCFVEIASEDDSADLHEKVED